MIESNGLPSVASKPRPALRLVKTQQLSRAEWLDVRRQGIGSSDAAAAVGLSPYQSPLELWAQKTGKASFAQPDPDDDSQPMYWGTLLEPIVAAHYTRRTGRRVRRVNAVLQHPEHPWMLANLDREVLGTPEVQILECKTAGIHGARLWRDGVPEYVQLQVMHQLAVTGKQAADVIVLIGGQELRIHRIERDAAVIERLIELEAAFWQRVQDGAPPPADGSASAERALQALYPQDSGQTLDWTQDMEMGSTFSDLQAVRERLKAFELQEAQLRQRIEERMGEASRAVFETGEVTFRRIKDSVVLDTKRLLQEQPGLKDAYGQVRAGSRRFVLRGQTAAD
ncbi:MAG: YqaJ viral recombinase family protein [Proteobacteria bacterium]|nr:YqaJ viral recombinase family protein [Pseudomonadota bacterium]